MIVESYEDVIAISGDIRSNQWETIHTAISLMLKRHPTGVIIDCSGLRSMTEAGAETFRDAMDFIHRHEDARFILAAVPKPVLDVLKIVPEVRSQLPISPTVEDARRSLDIFWQDPDEVGKKKKKLTVADDARQMIVCLYTGTSKDEDNAAMSVASEIADSRATLVHLVCALVVPRELPLEAPLADAESSALDAVRRARAFFDDQRIVHEDRIERARDVASAIANIVEEVPNASIVVVPLKSDPMMADENAKMMKNLLGRVSPEVIFVRAPQEGANRA